MPVYRGGEYWESALASLANARHLFGEVLFSFDGPTRQELSLELNSEFDSDLIDHVLLTLAPMTVMGLKRPMGKTGSCFGHATALVAPHSIPRCHQERGIVDKVEHIIETTARISRRPTVQFRLHPNYSRPRRLRVNGPRNTRIHKCVSFCASVTAKHAGPLRHVVGFPDPGLLRALRPIPARSTGHSFSQTLCRWLWQATGRAGTVPTFTPGPFDGIGTQLCPSTIATATPQAFTVASGPATSPSPRVPHTTEAVQVRDATQPMSARFWAGGFD